MNMESHFVTDDYSHCGTILKECFAKLATRLRAEATDHVAHNLLHGEFEIAYESLVLACIEAKVPCSSSLTKTIESLGISLQLDRSSVFDADFWQHAQEYFRSAELNSLVVKQEVP